MDAAAVRAVGRAVKQMPCRSRMTLRRPSEAKPRPGVRRRSCAAVDPAGRLPCGTRPRGPSRNSLRSLRSLRSNNRDESDVEARAARARPRALRSSAPHNVAAGAHPTTALPARPRYSSTHATAVPGKAAAGYAPAATYAAPRSVGLRGLRVGMRRRAGHTLFEHRAQRRCESSVAPARGRVCVAALAARAPQGTLREAGGAAFERRRIPGRGFAALGRSMHSRTRT